MDLRANRRARSRERRTQSRAGFEVSGRDAESLSYIALLPNQQLALRTAARASDVHERYERSRPEPCNSEWASRG